MASTFFKRYELSRQNFYAKTKQFPQLKTSSDGKQKTSGIGDDLKELDSLLDSAKMDTAKLSTVFQNFNKHARMYAEQLSYSPGKGVMDWMTKTTPVSDKDKKSLVDQTKEFQSQIESLIKDVDVTVQSEMEKNKSRSQTNVVLKAIQDDVKSWSKYLELQGVKVVSDAKFTTILLVPTSNNPLKDVVRAQAGVQTASADWTKLISQISKVDCSPVLSSSTKKSIAVMDQVLHGMQDCVRDFMENLQMWNNEYKILVKTYEDKLKKTPDDSEQQKLNKAVSVLDQLIPIVDASKRRIGENVELKVQASRKLLKNLSA